MKAVILAGGLGTRLKPFTQVIPKPLLPIGASSVLEIQVRSLKSSGIDEIFVATNHMSDLVQAYLGDGSKYGVNLKFSRETKPLGTCGPLSLIKEQLDTPFLMMNGDVLTKLDFRKAFDFAVASEADLTVVTTEITTPFHFGRVIAKGDYLVDIEEKPNFKLEILAGIYVLRPAAIDLIPADTYYGIDSLIKDMLARQRKIARYPMSEYWLDIGQIHHYEAAQEAYDEHFKEQEVGSAQ
jgi:NDP-sugar pyrophosphorylase family protein